MVTPDQSFTKDTQRPKFSNYLSSEYGEVPNNNPKPRKPLWLNLNLNDLKERSISRTSIHLEYAGLLPNRNSKHDKIQGKTMQTKKTSISSLKAGKYSINEV